MGFSITNHPFGGTPIYGSPHIYIHIYIYVYIYTYIYIYGWPLIYILYTDHIIVVLVTHPTTWDDPPLAGPGGRADSRPTH